MHLLNYPSGIFGIFINFSAYYFKNHLMINFFFSSSIGLIFLTSYKNLPRGKNNLRKFIVVFIILGISTWRVLSDERSSVKFIPVAWRMTIYIVVSVIPQLHTNKTLPLGKSDADA
jgi:hypothetical protein